MLLERIRGRRRDYEKEVSPGYIHQVHEAYNHSYFHYKDTPLLVSTPRLEENGMSTPPNLAIGHLLEAYRAGRLQPAQVVATTLERIPEYADDHIWIRPLESVPPVLM